MNVDLVQIDSIVGYARNPRRNEKAIPKVKSSLKEYGFRQPIVVDADGVIVVGHTRWMAAKELGMTEVPVHVAENLTPAQIKGDFIHVRNLPQCRPQPFDFVGGFYNRR
jgi:ParB-like chromosome segregation protein Spo0J